MDISSPFIMSNIILTKQAQSLTFSFWENSLEAAAAFPLLLGISQPTLADVSVPFHRILSPKRIKFHMEQRCSRSPWMKISSQMQKTHGKVLISDRVFNFLNSKTLKAAWKSFTIAGWASERMETFSKMVLPVSQKILVTLGVPGCAQSWNLLPTLDTPFEVRYGQVAQQQECKGVLVLSFLIPSCSLFPLHTAFPACEFMHHNSSQVFLLCLGTWKKMWAHRIVWVGRDPKYHLIPTPLSCVPPNLALSISKDGESTTSLPTCSSSVQPLLSSSSLWILSV